MNPEMILDGGFVERMSGQLIFAQGDGTCLTAGGMKTLDFFVASKGLAKTVKEVLVVRVWWHSSPPCTVMLARASGGAAGPGV
eukprot:1130800-Pyramimonas_sp.AAC.1